MSDVVYHLDMFRKAPVAVPPGRHCRLKPGDVVAVQGKIGEILSYEGSEGREDIFAIDWDTGEVRRRGHGGLRMATNRERIAFVDRKIDMQPEPIRRSRGSRIALCDGSA